MIVMDKGMRSPKKESLVRLDDYLRHGRGKTLIENRVAHVFSSNTLTDLQAAENLETELNNVITEMTLTARKNYRSKSAKFLHLIASLPVGEHLTQEQWEKTASTLAAAIDMQDHQYVAYVHKDTDNEHMHLVLCKVHPDTGKIAQLSFHLPKLQRAAAALELELEISQDNHKKIKDKGQRQAEGTERLTGQQSFFSYISNFKAQLLEAKSWNEIHQVCAENGVTIAKAGRGMIFSTNSDGTNFKIKASSVDRALSLSKLSAKLGEFIEPQKNLPEQRHFEQKPVNFAATEKKTTQIFAEYQKWFKNNLEKKKFLLAEAYRSHRQRDLLIQNINKRAQRAVRTTYNNQSKKYFEEKRRFKLLVDASRKQNQEQLQRELKHIKATYRTPDFVDWLKERQGIEALDTRELLLSRKGGRHQSGDNSIGGLFVFYAQVKTQFFSYKRTNKGQDIYTSYILKGDMIRDDGMRLIVSKNPSLLTVDTALALAKQRFDLSQPLIINGSAEFQRQVAVLAAQQGLKVLCANSDIQNQYEKLRKGAEHVRQQRNSTRAEWAGINRETVGRAGRGIDRHQSRAGSPEYGKLNDIPKLTELTNLASHGERTLRREISRTVETDQEPRVAASGDHLSLPQMPGSAVDRKQNRSQMLLPDIADHSLVVDRLQSDDHRLRREIPSRAGGNAAEGGVSDGREYVLKRNLLRAHISNIDEHRMLAGESGKFEFAGIRKFRKENCVLLKRDEIIFVKQINDYALRRLEKLPLQSYVKVLGNGRLEIKSSKKGRGHNA